MQVPLLLIILWPPTSPMLEGLSRCRLSTASTETGRSGTESLIFTLRWSFQTHSQRVTAKLQHKPWTSGNTTLTVPSRWSLWAERFRNWVYILFFSHQVGSREKEDKYKLYEHYRAKNTPKLDLKHRHMCHKTSVWTSRKEDKTYKSKERSKERSN